MRRSTDPLVNALPRSPAQWVEWAKLVEAKTRPPNAMGLFCDFLDPVQQNPFLAELADFDVNEHAGTFRDPKAPPDPPPLTLEQLAATQRMLTASRERYEADMRKWFRRNAVTSPFSAKHVAARGSIRLEKMELDYILHLDGKPIGTVKDVNFSDRPDAIAGELYTGGPVSFELSMVATTYAQEAIARYYRLREEETEARARLRRHSGSLSRYTGPRRRQQLERLRADFKKLAADLDAIVEKRRQALRGGPKL